jgi:hypothetical protein
VKGLLEKIIIRREDDIEINIFAADLTENHIAKDQASDSENRNNNDCPEYISHGGSSILLFDTKNQAVRRIGS